MRFLSIVLVTIITVSSVYALTGDMNDDGIVDTRDLSLFMEAFGSFAGDRNYNPAADLTGSERIDGEDLSILTSFFGRTSDDEKIYLISESTSASDVDMSITDPGLSEEFRHVERFKYVTLAEEMTDYDSIDTGQVVYVNLFDNMVYRAVVDRVHEYGNGGLAVRGRFQDLETSYFIVSTFNGVSLVAIDLPEYDLYYEITPHAHSNRYLLMEVDKSSAGIMRNAPPLVPPPETVTEIIKQKAITGTAAADAAGPQDHADIDMMIVYTPAAAQWSANRGGIENVVTQAMERAQLTFENSAVIANANLVYSAEVDYIESGSSYIDLYRLTTAPGFRPFGDNSDGHDLIGYMDDVHRWRDSFGADLVALFAQVNDVGGLGFLLTTTQGRPQFAFSLTRVQQAATSYTHIHEAGHNMGAHHHKEQLTSPGPGLFNYSAGWRWVGNDGGRYCSVMTYEGGSNFSDGLRHNAVAFFSNPGVNHMGVPTGHPQHGDNARTIREIKHVIAAYRTTTGAPPSSPSHLAASVRDTDTIHLQWRDNSTTALGFSIERRSGPDGHWVMIGASGSNDSEYFDEGISLNETYYYRVSAFNDAGTSGYSNVIEITVGMGW
jgi:hypothetical protein